mmetsp:Transcript_18444/g.29272  ORF Transcript_18444/g.29272 Transcript_18444/m.29272 type:complete len:212 (+) Transcript_18444:138-773(+)|eukprot:CAMPEP_0197055466 /NCGR_PEP_ID=MMETSP1384-20130603/66069_1 /TAXON_ID=29189 /ORGANISM="Ammonia sp." /LENGTH=211 /DNA_ID=CAMNT_0042489057 /DNA_START=130 /DNA_END=765 /DNA_ORIENTATION=+
MAKVDNKASNTQIMQMHSMKRKHGVVGKIEDIDLGCTDIIMYQSSKCLNVADPNKLPLVIRPNPDDAHLTSDPDVDGQIMIKLTFRDPVSLTALVIRATKAPSQDDIKKAFDDEEVDEEHTPSEPRLIKLFANKPELDFTDAEEIAAAQQIVLKPKQLKGDKIQLKALKFQRCTSVQIFFVDNQKGTEFTYVNRIGIIGRLAKAYHTEYGQ